MTLLTDRQLQIINLIRHHGKISNREIRKHVTLLSRRTIARELAVLTEHGFIVKEGEGRNIQHKENPNRMLQYFDEKSFFTQPRIDLEPVPFDFDVFNHIHNIFSKRESEQLENLVQSYQSARATLTEKDLHRTLGLLMIEFAWKSSAIEGNTYSLNETEELIRHNKKARDHSKEEAAMILNQKDAFDVILNSSKSFENLTQGSVENLHKIITQDLSIQSGIRSRPVRIGKSAYIPLDNPHQIREALMQTITIINRTQNPFEKAFIALLMISYIQPFEDGNKRTARMLTNALLAAGNCCPLSWRSVDENDYKKATIIFYETLSARFFKELFIEQCVFAGEEYFGASSTSLS